MKKIIILLIVCMTLLVACNGPETEIDENKFNIVTSFFPVYIATSNIIEGIEDVSVSNMTNTQVGCLHDYQLTTRDMNKLEKADVFIINGSGMEAFLDKAISAYPKMSIIDSSEGILDEHEKEYHEENIHTSDKHDDHGHNHGENAHVWVSVSLYIEQVKNIAEGLAKADPTNSEKYMSNAQSYIQRLEVLKDEMHEGIDELPKKNVVTFHEAFEFFAEEFGLNVVAVIEREPGTNPSAGEVAKIIDKISSTNASAIFVEPQYETSTANVIARETGIPVYVLDPIVTGKLESGEYENLMRKNLEVLKEALK